MGQRVTSLPPQVLKRAKERLERLDAAARVNDLRLPPSHRLERLHGDRAGQWSIRVNHQWRICFVWREGNVYEAEIVDYH
jgi:proteic killer suppression protein